MISNALRAVELILKSALWLVVAAFCFGVAWFFFSIAVNLIGILSKGGV